MPITLMLTVACLSFYPLVCLLLGTTVPSYRRQRAEDGQLCSQRQRLYLRGDTARDEESQGVAGSVCKGGRLQESGIRLARWSDEAVQS